MDKFIIDSSVGYLLNRTALKLNTLLTRRLNVYNVTPEQFVLLTRLMEEDGLSQKELALRSEKDPPGVTRILDSMVTKGLIKRENQENDRRTFSIFLTEKARAIYNELVVIEQQTMKDMLNGLTEEEINFFRNVLKQIKKNVEK
ncbi:MAG TPA: MarR family transcriptional regulator [Neobacillus sp.]|jgi:DNA-binding MarR family transcriptional regulator